MPNTAPIAAMIISSFIPYLSKKFFGHFVLGGNPYSFVLEEEIRKYCMNSVVHYKDLSEWYWNEHDAGNTPVDVPVTILTDPAAEDGYAYWVDRLSRERPSIQTRDFTVAMAALREECFVEAPVGADVPVHIIADRHNRDFCENLYWRGGDACLWDLTAYEPGAMGIPEHATSTPHLRGLLTVGGAADPVWREGRLWMDHRGRSGGYAVPVSINRSAVAASVYELSRCDLGELMEATAFARAAVHTNYWLNQLSGDPLLLRCAASAYRHTRALGLDYRRRLDFMRHQIRRLAAG